MISCLSPFPAGYVVAGGRSEDARPLVKINEFQHMVFVVIGGVILVEILLAEPTHHPEDYVVCSA